MKIIGRFTRLWGLCVWLGRILLNLIEGKEYAIIEYDPPRNLGQNAILHAYLSYVANETGNSMEWLKELMKKKFASKRKLVQLWKKRNYVTIIESTSKMKKSRFSEFFRDVELFFTEHGYPLPERNSKEMQSLLDTYNNS